MRKMDFSPIDGCFDYKRAHFTQEEKKKVECKSGRRRFQMMAEIVGAAWLASKLRQSAAKTLVLDARSEDGYSGCCIYSAVRIHCDGMLLRRLKKGTIKMASLLASDEDKEKYSAAKTSEDYSVVICDQNSESVDSLAPDSMAALLLKKVCSECLHVAFLEGGYESFNRLHPELCQSSSVGDAVLCRPSNLSLKLTTVAQPTLELVSHAEHNKDMLATDDSRVMEPFQILPYLFLGGKSAAKSLQGLRKNGITRVLNITTHIPNFFQDEGVTYKRIPVEDRLDVDLSPHLEGALHFIEETSNRGEKVLVHCHAGRSRSVTVVMAYLIKFYNYSMHGALDHVKSCKPDVNPNLSFIGQLLEYEEVNCCRLSPADSGLGSSPVESLYFMPSPPLSATSLTTTPLSFLPWATN